jgi:hypothetical protein
VKRVFVASWLTLAGLRARFPRSAGDGGAHAHGSSYPANRQGTEHPLRAMSTTKPYNTYTPVARQRLLRHYLSRFNRRFAQAREGLAAQYLLSAEHSKKVRRHCR